MARTHQQPRSAAPPPAQRDSFVFLPASHAARAPYGPALLDWDADRPAAGWTLTRIVGMVTLVAVLLAGACYALGYLIKLQLDKLFAP